MKHSRDSLFFFPIFRISFAQESRQILAQEFFFPFSATPAFEAGRFFKNQKLNLTCVERSQNHRRITDEKEWTDVFQIVDRQVGGCCDERWASIEKCACGISTAGSDSLTDLNSSVAAFSDSTLVLQQSRTSKLSLLSFLYLFALECIHSSSSVIFWRFSIDFHRKQ